MPKKDVKKSKTKKNSKTKKIISTILTILMSFILITIITGCIVVTSLTVYVMKFTTNEEIIDLNSLKENYTSIIYGVDDNNQPVEIQKIYSQQNRIWVSLDDMPQNLRDAFVYSEDQRFYKHTGVDWKRTFSAFANTILKFNDAEYGGSTITQQLVKNITQEKSRTTQRKIKEIFRAIELEKKYTKDQILEAYLNIVHMAYGNDGVETAAQFYFGKHINELTLLESASLAAMTPNPVGLNPLDNPEKNKGRRKYVLMKMLEFGAISRQEYDENIDAELILAKENKVDDSGKKQNTNKYYSYYVDYVIEEVIRDLQNQRGYDRDYAQNLVFNGGYKIYTPMNVNMQKKLEEQFLNYKNFSTSSNNMVQSAGVVMDYKGNVLALVGGFGAKEGNRVLNRATQSARSPGSTMKPIGVYTQGIEHNLINWSSMFIDSPVQKIDNKNWPQNYDRTYTNGGVTVQKALEKSLNTVPVKILEQLTPTSSFNFLKDKLGFTTLVDKQLINGKEFTDKTLASLSLGALTKGTTLLELTASYQIFGNGGKYYKPVGYNKIVNSSNNIVLENKEEPINAISPETATVMNKLLRTVIVGPNGTGRAAALSNIEVVGKTGTAEDDTDQLFVGCTPYYVSGIWIGYDNPTSIRKNMYSSAKIWNNIMKPIYNGLPAKNFENFGNVVEKSYCTTTGLLANERCPSKAVGYYKPDGLPKECADH